MGKIQKRWKVGDSVVTTYSDRSTKHIVTDQSGRLVRVAPMVPKSSGLNAWLDSDWFWKNNSVI